MKKESTFKSEFIKKLKRGVRPLAVLQYKEDSTTVAGFPDTLVVLESITVFIEFKQHKNAKFRPLQKEWNKRLNDNGHFAFICYPENADEVYNRIKELM